MPGKYVEVDPGVELFVETIGEGDVLVFIPGFTFTTEVFEKQLNYFSKTNQVVVIDPRSHGKSTITVHGNDYVTHGNDLAKILQFLNIHHVTLVGWSFGCLTAWEYIKQNGIQNIKSLVMIDMPPKSLSINQDDWVEGPLDDIASLYNTYLRTPQGHRDFITSYITDVMVQKNLSEKELRWLVEQSMRTPYYIASNLYASGMFSDYRQIVEETSKKIPTLMTVAEHWAQSAIEYLSKISPNTELEVLGGHMMFWEHDEKFNTILKHFLSSH